MCVGVNGCVKNTKKVERMTNQEWVQTLNTAELADFLDDVENSESIYPWDIWLRKEHIEKNDENNK